MALQLPFPDGEKHPVTQEGIAAHWACDRVLMSWRPGNDPIELRSFVGDTCPENGLIITEEMIAGGSELLEDVWARTHTNLDGMMPEDN